MGQRSCGLFCNAIREDELLVGTLLPTNMAYCRNFFKGGKSIVMPNSSVMQIFLLFSDQIFGGKQAAPGGRPLWKKARI